jgi:hypothetical protein
MLRQKKEIQFEKALVRKMNRTAQIVTAERARA